MLATARVAAVNGITFGRLMTTAALVMSLVLLSGFTVGLLAVCSCWARGRPGWPEPRC
ncbi:hypothetical protein GCM10020220_027930 [Nonomuraea rubra]|uniref:hypothetical protein n=1 Tax=Nonomuraea rubra TaxID=46180 RepID=UPI0031EFFE28